MKVAIIPARGGSKRIPNKNIRVFAGKPMIVWSIEAAQKSAIFDQVLVSTDSEAIADVARAHGAQVPFWRPSELADDYSTTGQVMAHAVNRLIAMGQRVELACCLYATAPFVKPQDLQSAGELLRHSPEVDFVYTVTSFAYPIQRALGMRADGTIAILQQAHLLARSQDLAPAFHDAGQFYWGRESAWRRMTPVLAGVAKPWLLPRHQVQDIDTEEDWLRAEWLFNAMQRNQNGSE
jgi:pseudaminic acid cytidylyltransferase